MLTGFLILILIKIPNSSAFFLLLDGYIHTIMYLELKSRDIGDNCSRKRSFQAMGDALYQFFSPAFHYNPPRAPVLYK